MLDGRGDGMPFTHVDGRHLHDEIVGQVRTLIRDGTLRPGDRLPSEAVLCQVFGVSRAVLREAFSALRQAGVLQMRQGIGTFVAEEAPKAVKLSARPWMNLGVTASVDNLLALMEVRMILEPAAARLAAERATAEDIANLETAFGGMRQAVEARSVGSEEDYGFHRMVAVATHNAVFERLMDLIGDLFIRSIWVSRSRSLRFVDRPRLVLQEHETILQAVRSRDPDGAEKAMQAHLRGARQRLIDERGPRRAPGSVRTQPGLRGVPPE